MSLYSDLTEVLTPYANKIKELSGSLDSFMSAGTVTWVQGAFGRTDGTATSSTTAIRMQDYVPSSASKIVCNSAYKFIVHAWNGSTYVGHIQADGNWGKDTTYGFAKSWVIDKTSGYVYKVVLYKDAGGDISTSEGSNCVIYSHTDETLSIAGSPADSKVAGDAIRGLTETVDEIKDRFYEWIDVLTPDYSAGSAKTIIGASGYWSAGNDRKCNFYARPEGAEKIRITANSTEGTSFAFLPTTNTSGRPTFAGEAGLTGIVAGQTKEYDIPEDCNYFYFLNNYQGSEGQNLPSAVLAYVSKSDSSSGSDQEIIPLGLHEMPRNESALNIVKRSRQLTDIEWTPAVNLPRLMLTDGQYYLGEFKAGVKYKGIPYGRVENTMSDCNYAYATVGQYIDLATFITSVVNEKSRICAEDVGNASGHVSLAYATVCSGHTCYSLGVPEVRTANIENITGLGLVGKINDNGTLLDDSQIKIGDVLNQAGTHTAIITDIIRDDEGIIQFVEISDATPAGSSDRNFDDGSVGGVCRRRGWTRTQLYNSWGNYNLYRYNGTVPYTPSPYVNVGDEFDMYRIEHFPIMPYEGEGFTYKSGYIPNNAVKLVISKNNAYNAIRVYKDDVEISGSPFAITSQTEDYDVTTITTGAYKAQLCKVSSGNITNNSAACHWTIE